MAVNSFSFSVMTIVEPWHHLLLLSHELFVKEKNLLWFPITIEYVHYLVLDVMQ